MILFNSMCPQLSYLDFSKPHHPLENGNGSKPVPSCRNVWVKRGDYIKGHCMQMWL